MARRKHYDFKMAMELGTILVGFVRVVQPSSSGYNYTKDTHLLVECGGKKVIIPGNEVKPLVNSQGIQWYSCKEVEFIVTEVAEDVDLVFGSCILAYEKKTAPYREKLFNGEVVEGVITNILDHGAYISVGGVEGLMRNSDFSDDGTAMKDVCSIGEHIRVKYLKTSTLGTYIYVPEKKRQGDSILKFEDLTVRSCVYGTVVSVYPDRVYVNIAPNLDCMCENPKWVDHLKDYEKVSVVLTKVDQERRRVRGVIKEVISR